MKIDIHPNRLLAKFAIVVALLLCANTLGLVSKFYFDNWHVFGLVPLFDFNTENNIPTLYSSFALVFSSLLLYCIGMNQKILARPYLGWLGLSAIFLFLSIDEAAQLHERLAAPVRSSLGTSGLFFFAWVIPYGLGVMIFVGIYARFLLNLPRRTMWLFIAGGAIFVSGAIGLELFEGRIVEVYGARTLSYAVLYTIEELMEMCGILIFIYGLITYIGSELGTLKITVSSPENSLNIPPSESGSAVSL